MVPQVKILLQTAVQLLRKVELLPQTAYNVISNVIIASPYDSFPRKKTCLYWCIPSRPDSADHCYCCHCVSCDLMRLSQCSTVVLTLL